MGFQSIRRAGAAAGSAFFAMMFASSLSAQAVVRGVLYNDATGAPVRGAVMLVDPATDAAVAHTTTDSLGAFNIQFSNGTFQLAAVHPGYTAVLSAPIAFRSGERLTVRIPIAEEGEPKHEIGVLEHIRPKADDDRSATSRDGLDMGAFDTRRTVGLGLHYDRSQLQKSTQRSLGEFLQNVPGFRVLNPSSTNSMAMTRSQAMTFGGAAGGGLAAPCRVGWFIDGHRMDIPGRADAITDGLGSMSLDAIEGIEIFRGLSEMPAEFAEPDLRCGAVAIWTRRG